MSDVIDDAELAVRLDAKKAPRVTAERIEGRIDDVAYHQHGLTTLCCLTLVNGYTVWGKAACVSADNFDEAIGKRVSYDDAFGQIWPLEGYLLAERLYAQGNG